MASVHRALLRPSLEQSAQFCSLISRLTVKIGNILKKEGGMPGEDILWREIMKLSEFGLYECGLGDDSLEVREALM